jgi:molecular chaperone GrpE
LLAKAFLELPIPMGSCILRRLLVLTMSKHKNDKHKNEPFTADPNQPVAGTDAPPVAPAPETGAEPLPVPAPHAPLTAEETDELRAKATQAAQWHDQWLRAAAELDNFKKRAARERQEAVRFANEGFLQKLVPVLDNIDMAAAALAGGQTGSLQALQTGVAMILQQLRSVLAEVGLEEVDATGKPFDPNLHEAVSQETSTEAAEGQVLRQLRKGYKLRERLLRPAAVVVAKAASKEDAAATPG